VPLLHWHVLSETIKPMGTLILFQHFVLDQGSGLILGNRVFDTSVSIGLGFLLFILLFFPLGQTSLVCGKEKRIRRGAGLHCFTFVLILLSSLAGKHFWSTVYIIGEVQRGRGFKRLGKEYQYILPVRLIIS
jgi:hypothetical protein